ncbi:von Willebrand factor type A domain protein [Rubripirellula amarantea]|uniref:von Willebrand factor type A domain protein n=1 Tax=Rubripirellula amarantea TaxID=2527999 RepID=A0A5C5WTM7_9BACT|nr:VWA domain-containing protein [Rubripirellula amarantea]TWT53908.1 von Willebrand factor type A domain protein [Rubripirellula amarantea]
MQFSRLTCHLAMIAITCMMVTQTTNAQIYTALRDGGKGSGDNKGDGQANMQQTGQSESVDVQVRLSNPTMLSGKNETNYVRISLKGTEPAQTPEAPPVNVAIVIDTSGSMQGGKIEQARNAAIAAIDRLRDDDIVSVVLYDSVVTVLVPATKASDRELMKSKIRSIRADGSTALFAGVAKGAAEVRKFLSNSSVNRVILLSDGQANIGPSSPRELERLGASLVKEGISVTTLGLGLGYNEDLMSGLAASGSGNHIFVEEAQDLVAVFNNEFNDLMSVVASDFKIKVTTSDAVRPVRVLGTKADIVGHEVYLPLAQLYSKQERYFVLEVEVDSAEDAEQAGLLSVDVDYQDLISGSPASFHTDAIVRFTRDIAEVKAERDYETFAYCNVQIANEKNIRATALRDAGQIAEAERLLTSNAISLEQVLLECRENDALNVLPELEVNIKYNRDSASMVKEKDWNRSRKVMRGKQNEIQSQQSSGILDYFLGGGRSGSSSDSSSSR